jgi:hypothetical protein
MSKPKHAADLKAAEEIASATEFSVFRQFAPGQRFVKRGIPSLIDAIALAEAIEQAHPGRPCLIYAIIRGEGEEHDQPISHEQRAAASAQSRGLSK